MAIENITGNESVEDIQKLYALVENRLRILDEKRSYTKPEIYQKVRSEYEAKLFEIQVLLEEKGAGLQEALDAAAAEREALAARRRQLKDELEELELRAVIGEVNEASFAGKQQALQEEMSGIDAKAEELTGRIEQYQHMIGGQAALQPARAEPEPEPVVMEQPAPRPPSAAGGKPAQPPAPSAAGGMPAAQPVPRPVPVVQAPQA
ncbi:MAG: hypothetical protein QME74_11875, partial [Candidatus Edwardsbacteria bacterium]|nr:hypothetical protein [Candidatus Edwardsbacteria bacterium]